MADLPGTVTWFKRVQPSMVRASEIAGWVVEPVAPTLAAPPAPISSRSTG